MRTGPILGLALLCACGSPAEQPLPPATNEPEPTPTLFRLVPPEESGIHFVNRIREDAEGNFARYQYMYNGNGVAVGDINGDGLPDIYLTSNQGRDALYLNRGGLRFDEVGNAAGILPSPGWKSGACMVDVDGDGDLDIHVCRSGWYSDPGIRRNLLYINEGVPAGASHGIPTFREAAAEWGVDDIGHSVMAAFADLDGDGDLDMYLTNHPVDYKQHLGERLERMRQPAHEVTDRLYRNDGGRFTDVSIDAGILNYGHGLGLLFLDADGDGLTDIYVANDFQSPDYLYLNKGGMRFREDLAGHFAHISYFSMGVDAGDLDNDGLDELFVVEMLPWERKRAVMNLADMDEHRYRRFVEAGFHHQLMRNTLQYHHGTGRYSDIAWLTGTAATDWSWATLIADLDNDGLKDILVANGYLRDTQDKDFRKREIPFIQSRQGRVTQEDLATICRSVKIPNRVFRNMGGLAFAEVAAEWGMDRPAFSYGAAYADLDGDGDLDLVITNTDLLHKPEPVFLLENRATAQQGNGWLRIAPRGMPGNSHGEGVRARIRTKHGEQWQGLRSTRGYQSSVEPIIHFGLGDATLVDELELRWPDGRVQRLTGVPSDTLLHMEHGDARHEPPVPKPAPMLRADHSNAPSHTHEEPDHDDFAVQHQLPERLSRGGPCMAVADADGDGLPDLFVGGGAGQAGALYLSKAGGGWRASHQAALVEHAAHEDRVAVFLDANGDGHPDLYVGSGSTEFGVDDRLQDRLYLNDGRGGLRHDPEALPRHLGNTGAVAVGDVNGDGHRDLYVGVRSVPGGYPAPPVSQLLVNDGSGRFNDATTTLAPALARPGMITAASFADLDGDGDEDLVVLGDWMAPLFMANEAGRLVDRTATWCPQAATGWWRSIIVHDVDGDGAPDIVAGNQGLNHRYRPTPEHPLRMLQHDFDRDGRHDIVLARWEEGAYRPDRSLSYLQAQFPFLRLKFEWHEDFAAADLRRVFGAESEQAGQFTARTFASTCFMQRDGVFVPTELPTMAQLSSIDVMVLADVNGDGLPELVVAGNTLDGPVETGSNDAGIGAVLRWEVGNWMVVPARTTGFCEPGMVRGLAVAGQQLLVGVNRSPVRAYRLPSPATP